MFAITANGVSELVRAFGIVLWPAVVTAGLVIFRRPLADLLSRVKRAKIMGQEVELAVRAADFERNPPRIEVETTPPTSAEVTTGEESRPSPATVRPAEVDTAAAILEQAERAPRVALIDLAQEIESEARKLIAATGHLSEVEGRGGLIQMTRLLERVTGLRPGTFDVVVQFSLVVNQLLHDHDISDDEMLRAIYSGVAILRGLQAVPHERNFVAHPNLDVYDDPTATTPLADVKGVLLLTVGVDGKTAYRAFPTTRDNNLRKGQEVSWEWNRMREWDRAWYRDPESGGLTPAWESSLEFAGRPLEELSIR